jgi:glutathione peroxidase-family protein
VYGFLAKGGVSSQSEVNGRNMNDVFAWLKAQKGKDTGGIAGTTAIKW